MENRFLVWAVNLPVVAIIAYSAVSKLLEMKWIVEMFRGWGLRPYLTTIGLIELGALLLFLFPPTLRFGFFLLCSYFGGAIAITLQRGDQPAAPALTLAWLWIAARMRQPALFAAAAPKRNEFDYLR